MDHLDKTILVLNNFNLCPLTESPVLGTECLQCEHMNSIEEEFFCTYAAGENPDALSIREIINRLLDLLVTGQTTVTKDEIIRMITNPSESNG